MKRIIKTKEFFFLILFLMILSLSSFIAFKFDSITTQINTVARKLYLATVDVSNMQISSILIDATNGNVQYDTSYTWNSDSFVDVKNIVYQINYKKTDASKSYKAGDLEFKVDNFLNLYEGVTSDKFNKYFNNIIISADPKNNSNKEYDWSYEYSSDSKYIILRNNYAVEVNSNFEGSIQISYMMTPVDIFRNADHLIKATLNNTKETNEIRFNFTATKQQYSLYTQNQKMDSLDGLPSGDYIWVEIYMSFNTEDTGPLIPMGPSTNHPEFDPYIEFDVEDDMLVLNKDFNLIERDSDGKVKKKLSTGRCFSPDLQTAYYGYSSCYGLIIDTFYYFGIPKEKYFDQTLTYDISINGVYSIYNSTLAGTMENDGVEVIASKENSIKVSNFDFVYTGNLYSVTKYPSSTVIDINDATKGESFSIFDVKSDTVYVGTAYDMKIGDDLLLYSDSHGIHQLTDNEYYFNNITFPSGKYYISGNELHHTACFTNGNSQAIPDDKYDVDLYVRYKGSSNFILYQSFKNKNITFDNFDQPVVGFYFYIHDLIESVKFNLPVYLTFNIPTAELNSTITNFDYIEIYQEDKNTPVNTPTSTSYYTSLSRDYVMPYDTNTYGRYMQRGYATNSIENLYTYISSILPKFSNFNNVGNNYESKFQTTVDLGSWARKNFYYAYNYKGYIAYVLLSEGLNYDDKKTIEESIASDYDVRNNVNQYFLKSDGTHFSGYEYSDFIKNHVTYQVINNWNNTNRTMIVIKTDFSDSPLDLRLLRDKASVYFYNLDNYYIPVIMSADDVTEYGTVPSADVYISPLETRYYNLPTTNRSYVKDSIDINSNGNVDEYFCWSTAKGNILAASESNQDLIVFAKTNENNYVSSTANISLNSQYTYKLRARNANNKITNLVIYDSIEKYVKKSGSYVLASGGNEQFYGTFQGVDTSYAESQGYTVKVYYSENDKPGSLGSDSSWKVYSSSTDKSKVKSLAFEYLNSSNNKAVLPENSLTYVEIIMKSPASIVGTKYRTYNGAWVEWNALDTNNQIITDIVGINSNFMDVSLPATLKVKHLDYYNHNVLAPEEVTENLLFGKTYTTRASTSIPINYEFATTSGDDPYGTISKGVTEVIYYYKKKDPITTINGEQTATPSIDKRTDTVSYHIGANYSIQNYLGDYSYYESMTLPYEIDLTKSNLDGGTYNATSREITWREDVTIDTMNKHEYSVDHNASVVYKNLPISVTEITANLKYTHVYTTDVPHGTGSSNDRTTEVKEKYKITVKHLENGTSNVVAPEETYYKYYNESYEYGISSSLPGNYQLKTRPSNYKGNVLAEETVITYLYEKKNPNLTSNVTITSTDVIEHRVDAVTYNLNSASTVKDFIGSGTVTDVVTLPYEIDLSKSNIDGGTYNLSTKKITWTNSYEVTTADTNTVTTSHEISVVYKNIPISVSDISANYESTISNDLGSKSSSASTTTNIHELYKIIVKHLEDGTNNVVAPEETYYKYYNESYEYGISSSLPGNYQLKTRPSNYKGNVLAEETIVTYLYEKKTPILTGNVNITGVESIDNRFNPIDYKITYNGSVKDLIGEYNTNIEIELPYEIDLSKSNIDGGTYNASNKTITWNNVDSTTSIDKKDISYEYNIEVVYKDVPISTKTYNVKATSNLSAERENIISESLNTINVLEKYKLVVRHLQYETNKVLAIEETYYKLYDEEYNTSPSSEVTDNYTLKITPSNYRGSIKSEETVVTYYYEMIDSDLITNINVECPEVISEVDEEVHIKITYKFTTSNYLGDSQVTINDILPYDIDESKSDLDGGTYNSSTKTITWVIDDTVNNLESTEKEYTKGIKIVFINAKVNEPIVNNVSGSVVLENNSNTKETSGITDVKVYRNIIVKYIDIDTNESISEDTIFNALVGESYTPVAKTIEDYSLVSKPDNDNYVITINNQTLTYKYKKRVKEVAKEEIPKVDENPQTGEFKAYYLLLIPITIFIVILVRISKRNIFKRYV